MSTHTDAFPTHFGVVKKCIRIRGFGGGDHPLPPINTNRPRTSQPKLERKKKASMSLVPDLPVADVAKTPTDSRRIRLQ